MSQPIRKDQITHPFVAPHGEIVYELLGRAAAHKASLHSLAHILLPPGKASLRHHHLVSEESYYILKGQARMCVDGQEYTLGPGEACLILPPQVHQIFNIADEDLEFLAVCAPAWQPGDSYND